MVNLKERDRERDKDRKRKLFKGSYAGSLALKGKKVRMLPLAEKRARRQTNVMTYGPCSFHSTSLTFHNGLISKIKK